MRWNPTKSQHYLDNSVTLAECGCANFAAVEQSLVFRIVRHVLKNIHQITKQL